MNFPKLTTLFFATVAMMAAISCDKDDDTEVMPSLNGALTFDVSEFVSPGQTVTMKPEGLRHPDDKGLGYYWKVTPGMSKADTVRLENGLSPDGQESDGEFSYTFPDSLGTFTVGCYGFAYGYSTSYVAKKVTVVKGGLEQSITNTGILPRDPSINFNDIRYYYVNHSGTDWFRNNLADPSAGAPYVNAPAMSNVFGRYYSYEEAINACPEGWTLPSNADWVALAKAINPDTEITDAGIIPGVVAGLMADIEFNSVKMWEYWPAVGDITDKAKFAAIPAGYANLGSKEDGRYPTASFFGSYEYSVFWTSDKVEDEEGMAYYRYFISDQPDLLIGKGDMKTFGASVRCIRK